MQLFFKIECTKPLENDFQIKIKKKILKELTGKTLYQTKFYGMLIFELSGYYRF